jgi:PadR family transcriptional regulator, regulatory protein PadR
MNRIFTALQYWHREAGQALNWTAAVSETSRRRLLPASTVPLVLSVLAEGENYGYALIQRVRDLSEDRIEWTEGMLYPVLHWMEDQELIVSEWRAAESGRRRKYYRLRQQGHKALNAEKQQGMAVHETLSKLWKMKPHLT